MKKQIFKSICYAIFGVLLATLVLVIGVLYEYFSSNQMNQLQAETRIVSEAVERSGIEYLKSISNGDYRITYISSDGTVIYDNKVKSNEMENHLEREEIQDAIVKGKGESSRYSTTLMERQLYCAEKLSDGSILRLSTIHLSWWALLINMIQPIGIVVVVAIVIALLLAYRLSERIVKPLNELQLEDAEPKDTYEELSPLLSHISLQKEQLKAQEAELNRRKEEFETATSNMREGIVLLNDTGAVLSINNSASKILGMGKVSIGKDLLLFNNTLEIQELLRIAATGEYVEKIVPINGTNYQIDASPIKTDDKVAGIAMIIFDITEKEELERVRKEFTANVSHELKTPLQNISGSAELLANGMVKSADVKVFSERIFSEARRMITLIDDIIKLSHLDEGGIDYDKKDTNLYEIAELTHRNLLPVAEKNKIEFTLTGEEVVIKAFPELVSEIVYNLCDNAIKYNCEGGSVKVNVSRDGDKAVLAVSDTGIGIPAEEQSRIFERFYRVDKSHSRDVGGTGLGLSIVKHAAIIHNAEIEVTSKIGYGTEIKILFPI